MVTTSDVLFDRGLDVFGDVVGQVPADGWDRPSPCDGWTALDVFGHLSTSVRMGISVLRGEQPSWPQVDRPADLVSGDPVQVWQALAAECRSALDGADLDQEMDTPMGRSTIGQRLAFPAIDLYVHAWDIGQAADIPVTIPDDAIEFAHHYIDRLPPERVRGEGGAFGPEVDVPADATPTERFVAWTGRTPRAAA
jgi:uncharacterized protein (TIGR03086 family)